VTAARRLRLDLARDLGASALVEHRVELLEQRLVAEIADPILHDDRGTAHNPAISARATRRPPTGDQGDPLECIERGLHHGARRSRGPRQLVRRRRSVDAAQQLPDHEMRCSAERLEHTGCTDVEGSVRAHLHSGILP
jgi:hypothetical protein